MATVTRYVDPDATGTGDGSSWTDAYTSLNAWESAEQTNLVTDGDSHIVYCRSSSGTADTTSVDISGWTTGESNTITIEGESFGGKLNTSKYRLSIAASGGYAIRPYQNYTTIRSIQIVHAGTSSSSDIGIRLEDYRTSITVEKCLIKGGYQGIFNNQSSDSYVCTIRNNIIYNAYESGYRGARNAQLGSTIENNTVYNCNNGASNNFRGGIALLDTAITSLKNNLCYNNHKDFGDHADEQGDYNCSKDDTAYGTNSINGDTDSKTPDFVSTTAGSEDFHLQSTSDAISAGTDLSAYFTDDIDGDTRSSWDIGADEYVATVTFKPFWASQATRISL